MSSAFSRYTVMWHKVGRGVLDELRRARRSRPTLKHRISSVKYPGEVRSQ
jgi:hypothetical protein